MKEISTNFLAVLDHDDALARLGAEALLRGAAGRGRRALLRVDGASSGWESADVH